MTGRSRVSTRLYWAALSDAIDWQQSFLDSHDAGPDPGSRAHCGPRALPPVPRCGAYEVAARQLARYRAAQTALSRPARRNG